MAVPLILQNGTWAGRVYTVNRRLPGENFADWLAGADPTERPAALMSYLDAAGAVQQLPAPIPGFAPLVGSGAPAPFRSLVSLLTAPLQPQLEVSRAALPGDIPPVAPGR